jgi:hypothetical protein
MSALFDIYTLHLSESHYRARSLENREPSRALQMTAAKLSQIVESHHSNRISSPGRQMNAFQSEGTNAHALVFRGHWLKNEAASTAPGIDAVVRVNDAVHRSSAIATHERLQGFGKRSRSLQCPDLLEAILHERTSTLNGAHTIADIEVSEAVAGDCIEMMRHSNGSTMSE